MCDNTLLSGPLRPGGFILTEYNAKLSSIGKNSNVLDIGCGRGDTLAFLADCFGCAVSGIDCSEKACAAAKKRLPKAVIMIADAAELPFNDASFDAAFMECTLSLFDDPERALKEAYRILRPNGFLAVSTLARTPSEKTDNALPEKASDALLINQAVNLPVLRHKMQRLGFSLLSETDETSHLVQFTADVIFAYGSFSNYASEMQKQTDSCIFPCDISPKGLRYYNLLFKKAASVEAGS